MSQNQLPPPESEACLFRLRSSSQKGGTLIAEEVTDHATHERRICDPDGYRLPFCPRCGKGPLHVHDYRERVLRAELRKPVALIVRLICVSCEAIWQILPLFIARHLWRTWNVVRNALRPDHQASSPSEPQHWPKVPPRTVRRWLERAQIVPRGTLHRSTVHRFLLAHRLSARPQRQGVTERRSF